jgi:hypothetical protein
MKAAQTAAAEVEKVAVAETSSAAQQVAEAATSHAEPKKAAAEEVAQTECCLHYRTPTRTSTSTFVDTGMRSACRVVQVIAQLALVFPVLPASAIADALDKAGGDVQHAANALFAEQVNARLEYLLSSAVSRVL